MQPPLDFEGPQPTRKGKRKRRRRSYRLPKPFLVLLGLSAVFLLALPYIRDYLNHSVPVSENVKPFETGLTVAEVRFDGKDPRHLTGVVQNANAQPFGQVKLLFSLWSVDHKRSGSAVATIDYLPANGRVAFTSNEVSGKVVNFYVEEIAGQPAK